MPERRKDVRAWFPTDRERERLSICRPVRGVRLMSVAASHRHWCEAHTTFTVAAVHARQPPLTAEWRTRNQALATGPGGMMGMEPGDVHVTKRLTAKDGAADFDVIQFAPELVASAAAQLGVRGAFHFKNPSCTGDRALLALDEAVAAVARGEDALTVECAIAGALTAVIGELGEAPLSGNVKLDAERDYRLRRVREYLLAVDHRPTLAELEIVSELSQWRLCAVFKRSYGVSLGHFWNAHRLRRAVHALEAGETIALISSELGYTDEAYFSRVFKAQYGIAPGAWRSMFRGNDRLRRWGRG